MIRLDVGAQFGDAGGDDGGVQAVLERLDLDLDAALAVGDAFAQASGGVALGALASLAGLGKERQRCAHCPPSFDSSQMKLRRAF